jgi:hypothetical protein
MHNRYSHDAKAVRCTTATTLMENKAVQCTTDNFDGEQSGALHYRYKFD